MTGRLAVLAAACAVLLPAALHAQGVPASREKAMHDRGWGPVQFDDGTKDRYLSARADEYMDVFRDLLDRAQWSTVSGIDCGQHKDDMEAFYNGALMYWGTSNAAREGETIRAEDAAGTVEWLVVFDYQKMWKSWDADAMLDLLLHEGWHWTHKETKETPEAEDAERCASMPNEEDDDNPSDPGGTTCTEEEYTYTEWDWVYTEIEAGSCVGVSPVRWPWEEGGDDGEMHCTPAKWGYVLMEVEKTGVRTVCVPTSN